MNRRGGPRTAAVVLAFRCLLVAGLSPGGVLPANAPVGTVPHGHPRVTTVFPCGGQRGTEVSLRITGTRLRGIAGLTFFRPGIEVLEVKAPKTTEATARLRILADCPLGVHPMLVRTALGWSNLQLFHVGTLPEHTEKEPNNTPATAHKIPLGSTVNGRITNEDVDVFAVEVREGQQVQIEVQGLRLGNREFDPHLTVTDDRGAKIATVDDTIFGMLDPVLGKRCTRTGTWFLTLRENALGGSNDSLYRLHVGLFPRPLVAFPPGGKPGEDTALELRGGGPAQRASVRLTETGLNKHFVPSEHGSAPTPLLLHGSPHTSVLAAGHGQKPPAASRLSVWSSLGPFANPRDPKGASRGHDTALPPERDGAPPRLAGRDGPVEWTKQPWLRDAAVQDLKRLAGKSADCVLYLRRAIQAPTARRVLLLLSADDTLKAWVNGRLVVDDRKPSATLKDQHRRIVDLRAGDNTLLLKISNRSGPLTVYSRVLDPLRMADHRSFTPPAALAGVIAKPHAQDRFVFLAERGQAIDFRAFARMLRSPLDPVVDCYCTHDRFYLGNDDSRGLDSLLRFRAPFTGEFVLRVRDMLESGSDCHVYRIDAERPGARSLVTRTQLPGYRDEWTVSVPRG
ncbi:MAG: hypothetical protein KDC87_19930, partial [Planctomycetes bacterium]|nr:hypothetical protein [Planctomycetota bacterium]